MTRLQQWILGLIEILKGLAIIFTAAIYIPQWDLRYVLFTTEKNGENPEPANEDKEPTTLTIQRILQKEQERQKREWSDYRESSQKEQEDNPNSDEQNQFTQAEHNLERGCNRLGGRVISDDKQENQEQQQNIQKEAQHRREARDSGQEKTRR